MDMSLTILLQGYNTVITGFALLLYPSLSVCSLITSRVEVNILRSINPHFAKVKVNEFSVACVD